MSMLRSLVNTPPPEGGGFGLRLKAGSVGPRPTGARSVHVRPVALLPNPGVDLSPTLLTFNVGKNLTISSCCPIPCRLKAGGLQIPIGDSKIQWILINYVY